MDDVPVGPLDERAAGRARDARWVEQALAGDDRAFGRLYDAWFDRVFNLSLGIVGDPEVAAEVAQDTFLSAWRNLGGLEDHDAFGGWLLRIARNASFNRHKKESRSRAVGDEELAVIERTGASPTSAPSGFGVEERLGRLEDPVGMAADAELVALVHESAAALGPRDAEVLDLQLRYGLSPAEIGEVVGLNRNAANQLCHRIRGRFATAVRARVLWNGDRPACDQLDELLRSAGVVTFDAEAVRIADRHAKGCEQCGERRELRLEPAAMFASIPLVAAPVLLKAKAAAALEAAGVPMGGSGSTSAATATAMTATGAVDPVAPRGSAGSRRRSWQAAALVAAAVVLVVAIVAVLAEGLDRGTAGDEVAATGTVAGSTTVPTTEGPGPSFEPDASSTSTTSPPPVVVVTPTSAPPTTSTTAAPPIGVVASISPAQVGYTAWQLFTVDAPVLSWSVSNGGTSVRLVAPGSDATPGLASTSTLSGSLPLCPGKYSGAQRSVCSVAVGSYTYQVEVLDGSGHVVATSAPVTLEVTSPPIVIR